MNTKRSKQSTLRIEIWWAGYSWRRSALRFVMVTSEGERSVTVLDLSSYSFYSWLMRKFLSESKRVPAALLLLIVDFFYHLPYMIYSKMVFYVKFGVPLDLTYFSAKSMVNWVPNPSILPYAFCYVSWCVQNCNTFNGTS